MGLTKTQRGRWKAVELSVAKFWGMKRAHFEQHDTTGHPLITVEVKSRENRMVTISKFMAQAWAETPCSKVPVVQIHIVGDRFGDDLCIVRAKDLRDRLHVGVGSGEVVEYLEQ